MRAYVHMCMHFIICLALSYTLAALRKDSWSQEKEMREKTILWYFSYLPQLRTIIE